MTRNDFPNDELVDKLMPKINDDTINQFAMSIMGHMENRVQNYVYGKKDLYKQLNKIFKVISPEANVTSETPIISNMEALSVVEYMLNNVLATVIFFVCLLSFILIFSLMQTDVEERKYEFAVLRTLGMRNRSLITLITVQSLFFSIPGIILAFGFASVLITIAQFAFNNFALVEL